MKKSKIVFLVSHCPDALINKRIEMLNEKYKVIVIYNKRGNENFYQIENVDYLKLNIEFDNGRLFKRIFKLLNAKKQIKKIINKENPDYIYAFRLDMLLIIMFNNFKRKKIIYEVADLHEIIINDSKNIIKITIKQIIRELEKWACKYIDLLSLTSEKYYDVYFSKFVPKEKMVFMPNMPNLEYFKDYKRKEHSDFVIGFIGFVRYKKQMKMLIEAADITKTRVLFAGDSQDDEIKNLAKNSKYVEYYGKYNYNDEIADLYSKCDCIYSVYDTSYNNVKYALPNKLYEAIYCELPILVADETYLGEVVEKWGVGIKVDSNSLQDLLNKIKILKQDTKKYNDIILKCRENKEKINMYNYNNEFMKKIKGSWKDNG